MSLFTEIGIKPRAFFSVVGIFLIVVSGLFYVFPVYNVWQKGLAGEAELRQAEWNRQIAVKEAQSKFEASKSLALAEVERAKGVSQANKIIGESLRQNEAYLRYLWIQGMQTNQMQVVYVPTEGNLPILEAQRFSEYTKESNKYKTREADWKEV